MRRWIAILFLAVLPLQFSWAAVAAYCGHETGSQTEHLGHHEHQHGDVAGVDTTDADKGSALVDPLGLVGFGMDLDCGQCHGTCLAMLAPLGGMGSLAAGLPAATPASSAVRTLAQRRPERPQWLRLA